MAMMARMRSLAPWFIIMVGGLFVLFMVLSDSGVLNFMGQQSQFVGSINGEDVTYQEYSALVERARQNQEQSTGQSIDESQMDFFRDQVWDALVTQKLIDEKVKEFGIVVTDEEIRNTILGPNPPAMLKQQFTDSTGNFNRQLYEQALQDPRNKQIVLAVEEQIKQQLIQEKLQYYLFASITVSDEEAKDKFVSMNTKMRADYVMIDVNTIPDTDIKVTDADLKKYYNENLDQYKVEASKKIKYVLYRKQPSQSDSLGIKRNLEAVVTKLKGDTASFKSYVEIYSETPYRKDTLSLSALPPQVKDAIQNATKGEIIGPLATYEGYVVYRFNDKVKSKTETVRASHILVKSSGDDKSDLQKAMDIYNEVKRGANFATVAKQKSQDPGSGANGGDLGWFGRGQMVKEFEDACYSGKVGVIQKLVKSTFGYHIIKVTGKSNEDFVIEKIVNKIQVSASTIDNLFQNAQDFVYVANENGFESEAKLMKYDVVETPPFTEDAQSIPGLGMNQALIKWAFENGVGDVSEVFRVPAGYVVVTVSDVIKAGSKNFEEVQAIVRNNVIKEKKIEIAVSIVKDIRSRIGDNGDKNIVKIILPQARVDSTAEFTTLGTVPGLGSEFAFTEYAIKADLNKWSQPVKGNMGVYLINLRYRTNYNAATYEFEKLTIKKDILQQKKSRYFSQWVQDLKKEADITDNRYLFYR